MAVNLVQGSIHQAAQDAEALRQVFSQLTPDSCPRAYNFHMHTTASDGRLTPETLVEQAIAIGLKGFAITDHHSVDGYCLAQDALSDRRLPPHLSPYLWTGVEISAGLLDVEVHLLCYAFDPNHPAIVPYLTGHSPTGLAYEASQVIDAAHRAGGIVVLAHPARYRRSPQELIPLAAELGIDGVEAFYAYNNPDPWRPSPQQTAIVQQLAQPYGLLTTCGTDTHGFSLLQRL